MPRKSPDRADLTPELIAELRAHAERTGVGSSRLLRGARDKPGGLDSAMIQAWLGGKTTSAKTGHIAYVLSRWSSLPTRRRMALTPEMGATLDAEFKRTGAGPITILSDAPDRPPGLTLQVVRGWAYQTTNSVAVEDWEYVMARLSALPDAAGVSESRFAERRARQEIGIAELAELRSHRERTGIGGAVLLRNAADKPPDLTPAMISNWLSGQSKTAAVEHVAYVLARYRAWP